MAKIENVQRINEIAAKVKAIEESISEQDSVLEEMELSMSDVRITTRETNYFIDIETEEIKNIVANFLSNIKALKKQEILKLNQELREL